jgi:hypothetical protein
MGINTIMGVPQAALSIRTLPAWFILNRGY